MNRDAKVGDRMMSESVMTVYTVLVMHTIFSWLQKLYPQMLGFLPLIRQDAEYLSFWGAIQR